MEGWIMLHRSWMDDEFYFSEPFTKSSAWVDLLLLANIKPRTFFKRGIQVELNAGDIAVSVRELMERWMWSSHKVQRYLETLKRLHKIEILNSNVINIIRVVNWNKYQNIATQTATQTATLPIIKKESNKEIRKEEINKETVSDDTVKKVPVKKHYAEFVTMTEEEYSKLVLQFGQEQTTWMINKLDNYKGSKGKTYKSDYRAILSWVAKEYESNKNQTRTVNYGAEYANNAIGREAAREAAREQRRKEAYEWIANEINRCNAV